MARSKSQTYLLVVSIISLVFSGIVIATSIGVIIAGAGAGAGGAMGIVGALGIATTLFDVVRGVLGIRAANDAQKIMPVWVLALIGLVFAAIGAIMSIVGGSIGQNVWKVLGSLVASGFTFWIANNIKQQAGK